MALTYDTLRTTISDYLDRSDLDNVIHTFIELVEAKLRRRLRHWKMEKRATASLVDQLYDWLQAPCPELLDEEGRVMVLRALLIQKHKDLKLFRASARLAGFARQLSGVLREFQQGQVSPESLLELAAAMTDRVSLAYKLQDLALLLLEYAAWLRSHGLQDSDCLLSNATKLLLERQRAAGGPVVEMEGLWVDGFAEFTVGNSSF